MYKFAGAIFIMLPGLIFLQRQFLPMKLIGNSHNPMVSPFHHCLAFIRWNTARRDRIPIMEKYRPFFADLHYSIPDETVNLSYAVDGWIPVEYPYKAVADLLQIVSQSHSSIEGLFYFHFDAWISPLRFDNMDFRNIWFLDGGAPPFKCVKNITGWKWWAWDHKYHEVAKAATRTVTRYYSTRFITDYNVFCGGWSDIYYIPRRFFKDFIDLADVFYSAKSFHEVAIPTILNIIDLTYRSSPSQSIITRLADCWGNCCATGATLRDILRKRCGHRIDLSNNVSRHWLTATLDAETNYLRGYIKKAT